MADFDLGNLRVLLDEHEKFARAIIPVDPAFAVAQEMLEIIGSARDGLHPSADGTANFVHNKDIVEQLVMLRNRAENPAPNQGGKP